MSREVTLPPARVHAWLEGFVRRNGPITATRNEGNRLVVATERGGRVEIDSPTLPTADVDAVADTLLPAGRAAVVLLRRGGYSIATAEYAGGSHRVTASKTGSRYVQGRTAAGGQSQQRFARRRANQTAAVVEAAADAARRVLGDSPAPVDLLVTGGDRLLLDDLLAHRPLDSLVHDARVHASINDPKRAVIDEAVVLARSVHLTVTNAEPEGS